MNEENKSTEQKDSSQPVQPEVNEKIKYILIAIAAVLVVLAAVLVLFFSNDDNGGETSKAGGDTSVTETQETANSSDSTNAQAGADDSSDDQEQAKTYTPVFMYFVSKSDEGYSEYMSMIEELKEAYSDRVTFDIVDVDEEPESKDNFPVDGNTPMLIMTNTNNDISALEFKCSDKARLEEDIEKSFNTQQ